MVDTWKQRCEAIQKEKAAMEEEHLQALKEVQESNAQQFASVSNQLQQYREQSQEIISRKNAQLEELTSTTEVSNVASGWLVVGCR
jgi:oligoendopeptidase F